MAHSDTSSSCTTTPPDSPVLVASVGAALCALAVKAHGTLIMGDSPASGERLLTDPPSPKPVPPMSAEVVEELTACVAAAEAGATHTPTFKVLTEETNASGDYVTVPVSTADIARAHGLSVDVVDVCMPFDSTGLFSAGFDGGPYEIRALGRLVAVFLTRDARMPSSMSVIKTLPNAVGLSPDWRTLVRRLIAVAEHLNLPAELANKITRLACFVEFGIVPADYMLSDPSSLKFITLVASPPMRAAPVSITDYLALKFTVCDWLGDSPYGMLQRTDDTAYAGTILIEVPIGVGAHRARRARGATVGYAYVCLTNSGAEFSEDLHDAHVISAGDNVGVGGAVTWPYKIGASPTSVRIAVMP